jgi:hypothetical protein
LFKAKVRILSSGYGDGASRKCELAAGQDCPGDGIPRRKASQYDSAGFALRLFSFDVYAMAANFP